MCRLKDTNVVRVLGVVSRAAPLCVIVEYMKFGDLNQFLKQHVPESTMARKKSNRALRCVCGEEVYVQGVGGGMRTLCSWVCVQSSTSSSSSMSPRAPWRGRSPTGR